MHGLQQVRGKASNADASEPSAEIQVALLQLSFDTPKTGFFNL
jgi:hypothetical protein